MNIFLDESGSFVSAPRENSWNCIVAYMVPEFERRKLNEAVTKLKRSRGVPQNQEVKLREIDEVDYFAFLRDLVKLKGTLHAVATDGGIASDKEISEHRKHQANEVTKHKDRMIYESGRESLQTLSDQVRGLSPQLYIQFQCQIELVQDVLKYGVLYFVQRCPRSLGRFRWRIDQKNPTRTAYEKTFVMMTPGALQSMALQNPIPMLKGADYSAFSRFEFPENKAPEYLQRDYGFELGGEAPGLNVGKIIKEDIQFVNSQRNQGVQVADLLAAGVRRVLRLGFTQNDEAAELLGGLMLQREIDQPPVRLLEFAKRRILVPHEANRVLRLMERFGRPMLLGNRG